VNHEEPYRNQAERLRQKIEKVKDGGDVIIVKSELPSRTDIHRNKKNKTKLKVKFPIIRLLALFFILLPVVIISAYSVLGSKEINNSDKVSTVDRGGYEINVEDSDVLEPVGEEITEETPPIEEVEVIVDTEEEKNENASDEETIETVKEEESDTTNKTSTDKEQIQTDTSNKGETTSNNNLVYHTVQPNENLFRIALKYYQSQSGIEIIQKANNLNGNEIMVGQVLKIPK
jgi:LysM repeat protein